MENNDYPTIEQLLDKFDDKQLGFFILTKSCRMQENDIVDVISILDTCMKICSCTRDSFESITPERLLNAVKVIVEYLENISKGEGYLKIYKVNENECDSTEK